MAVIGLYNCSALGTHDFIDCQAFPKGGILSFGVLDPDHQITDFTDQADNNQAIADGELVVVQNVKGVFEPATPIEGENPVACGNETILDGLDNVLTIKDFNVRESNNTFYEGLNGRQTYLTWFECENDIVVVVERLVTWIVIPAQVPESNKEKQFYQVQAKWSTPPEVFPTRFTAPADIYT